MSEQLLTYRQPSILAQFLELTKPRVNALIVFTAIIGMMLAYPVGIAWDLPLMLLATIGIWLIASAAAAINCLVEQAIDRNMARTRARPTVAGTITVPQVLALAGLIGGIGLVVLYRYVNPLTMWLTLGTFVGYAVIYTVILKPATPQNIVIGGASGAMPPVLGWAAVAGVVDPQALLLFLIIFAWTPPHFWALALYRKKEYAKAGVPMLPVTHGDQFTKLHTLLYTFMLAAAALLPFVVGMAKWIYLASAVILNAVFIGYAIQLYRRYSDALAKRTFSYSILYLALLFAALLVDHYAPLLDRL
ncbi:protoheme IX farnesyltransferase [Betaproteobacteria bacterium UKL13-2]|nr:protoheme IX farnesyltransferase [Betaproteobacteria bacterium UKL13-2]HCG53464.1 protoheme IX farnesyltransferase [Betaproteobacteria bacterium]